MKNLFRISLVLNLVLAAVVVFRFPSASAPEKPSVADTRIPSQIQPAFVEATEISADELQPPPESLGDLDHREQVATLVGQGWTEEDAKAFALSRLIQDQIQWMQGRMRPGNQEYWRQPIPSFTNPEFHQEKLEEAMSDLFGIDVNRIYDFAPELPFSEETRKALAALDRDYQMMESEIHSVADGYLLPEDLEALVLLGEEKQKDLEMLLSPEEVFEYRLRTSQTAVNLRRHLDAIEPTEEEFRTVFQLQYEVDQLQPGQHGNDGEDAHKRYREASEALENELREFLGEDRYRRYERSQDWTYGRLISLTKRLDLPPERADEVFDIKDYAEAEQAKLRSSGEDRQAAMEALREEVREDIRELLGDRGAELYEEHGGGHWLMGLQ